MGVGLLGPTRLGALAAALAAVCGCEPFGPPDPRDTDGPLPGLYADEDDLTFVTSVTREHQETLSFTLWNGRDEMLTVTGHQDVDGPTPEAFAAGEAMLPFLEIEPLGYAEVPVTFRPLAQRSDYEGMIIIRSLTAGVEPVLVRLFGTGLAPVLSAELEGRPEAPVGCSADAALVIGNAGGEVLALEVVDAEDLGPFALLDELPASLTPGSQVTVPLRFTPVRAGAQIGLLRLTSDDPARPDAEIVLSGTGLEPEIVTESLHYSSGDGAAVLLLLEDGGDGTWDDKVRDGLDSLLDGLDQRGVSWRIAAASTETTCPSAADPWGEAGEGRDIVESLLSDVLFDGATGVYGDRLLELARRATEQDGPEECLEGWLTPGEPLHVVVFADADDESADGWEAEVERIRAAVAGDVVVSAVIPGASCSGSAQRYEAAALETGGLVLDLCAGAWATHWDEIGARTAAVEDGPTLHTTARKPIPGTIEVTVDGGLWPDVSVDDAAGVVSFPTPPPDGAEVLVRYVPRDICP